MTWMMTGKKDINEEKPSARDIWHEKLKNSDGKRNLINLS